MSEKAPLKLDLQKESKKKGETKPSNAIDYAKNAGVKYVEIGACESKTITDDSAVVSGNFIGCAAIILHDAVNGKGTLIHAEPS